MFVWRDLDTKTVLRRIYFLAVPFLVLLLMAVAFVLYQYFWGFSFPFFTGYGLFFELTPFGLKLFGNLLVPMVSSTAVFVAFLFIVSFAAILVLGTCINVFISPFRGTSGFENYGRVYEKTKRVIFQESKKGRQFAAAITLTITLAYLFLSLWFLSELGILVVNLNVTQLLLGFALVNILLSIYFEFRIQSILRKSLDH